MAIRVFHEEFGEGQVINGAHAQPDDEGYISWFDVMFEHGIERQVSSEELFTEEDLDEVRQDLGHHGPSGIRPISSKPIIGKDKRPMTDRDREWKERQKKMKMAKEESELEEGNPQNKIRKNAVTTALGNKALGPKKIKDAIGPWSHRPEMAAKIYGEITKKAGRAAMRSEEAEDLDEARGRPPKHGSAKWHERQKAEGGSGESSSEEAPGFHAQLLKHKDQGELGSGELTFSNGDKAKVSPQHREKALQMIRGKMGAGKDPDDRDAMIKHMGSSHKNFMAHMSGTAKRVVHPETAINKKPEYTAEHASSRALHEDDDMDAHIAKMTKIEDTYRPGGKHARNVPTGSKVGDAYSSYNSNSPLTHTVKIPVHHSDGSTTEHSHIYNPETGEMGDHVSSKTFDKNGRRVVGEELKGNQDEIDVAKPFGKLTKADFDALHKKGKKMTKEEFLATIADALAEGFITREELDEGMGSVIKNPATFVKAHEANEPVVTTYTESTRYRGVESAIRNIMSQNRDLRQEVKEATWVRDNSYLYEASDYTLHKVKKVNLKGETDDMDQPVKATKTSYDIHKNGEKVGELHHTDHEYGGHFFDGNLHGKRFPWDRVPNATGGTNNPQGYLNAAVKSKAFAKHVNKE